MLHLETFNSPLGWMAIVTRAGALVQLSFGHATQSAALSSVRANCSAAQQDDLRPGHCLLARTLRRRLSAYAEGAVEDFADVPIECPIGSQFTQRIVAACRAIGYGATRSYGQVAAAAGVPRAARAVGNIMARNRTPLVVPCHRVVHGDGAIGQFSAPQGSAMKRRLLALEAGSQPAATHRRVALLTT